MEVSESREQTSAVVTRATFKAGLPTAFTENIYYADNKV